MSLQQRTREFGEYMRFLTPLLLGICLFVLSDIRGSVASLNTAMSNLTPRVAVLEVQIKQFEKK